MPKLTRPYLILFNPIYWLITKLRNLFYDIGLIKSTYFNHPVIAIGNLSTGGTGKTPHTEYLLGHLISKMQPAVLSRGYRRKTTGYILATNASTADEIGDEPAQIKHKFPDSIVAVDADRVNGVKQLLALTNKPDAIVLDDAFQHRKLQAGFYILLTPFNQLYVDDFVLPAGNLREPRSGADRANCVVVTKCPPNLTAAQQTAVRDRLKLKPHQHLFFTSITYGELQGDAELNQNQEFVLVTGIANPNPLTEHLKSQKLSFNHLNYPDHHHFSEREIEAMTTTASRLGYPTIVTTEKDFQRLPIERLKAKGIRVSYLPIKVDFLQNEKAFLELIKSYISGY